MSMSKSVTEKIENLRKSLNFIEGKLGFVETLMESDYMWRDMETCLAQLSMEASYINTSVDELRKEVEEDF